MTAIVLALTAGTLLARPLVSDFDDLPAPFVAGRARNEAEIDRIEALAHFAAGRTYQQRGDYAQAVRQYARADRLDPAATKARSNLVVAAVQEGRIPLAARYALKGFDPHEAGERVLDVLGDYLAELGDLTHAIDFYEKALAAAHSRSDSPEADASAHADDFYSMRTRLKLGDLYRLAQKYAPAAEQFALVREALEHPDRFGINESGRKQLLGDEPAKSYELFGEAFLMADRFAEAEAAFRQSQAVASNEALLKFNLARIAARRGQAQEALAGLQIYLDRGLTAEGSVPYQLLADVLKKLGKESEVLDRLQKLHAAAPSNALLTYFLAEQNFKAGRTERAEPLYLELSEKSPTMLGYRSIEVYRRLAEIYRKGRQYEKLLALLGKVMSSAGTLEVLGPEAKPLATDAELFGKLDIRT